jgi:hypothetical protein
MMLMWQRHVAEVDWEDDKSNHIWTCGSVTLVNIQANVVVPHGSSMGSHVEPNQRLNGKLQKSFGGPWVLNP